MSFIALREAQDTTRIRSLRITLNNFFEEISSNSQRKGLPPCGHVALIAPSTRASLSFFSVCFQCQLPAVASFLCPLLSFAPSFSSRAYMVELAEILLTTCCFYVVPLSLTFLSFFHSSFRLFVRTWLSWPRWICVARRMATRRSATRTRTRRASGFGSRGTGKNISGKSEWVGDIERKPKAEAIISGQTMRDARIIVLLLTRLISVSVAFFEENDRLFLALLLSLIVCMFCLFVCLRLGAGRITSALSMSSISRGESETTRERKRKGESQSVSQSVSQAVQTDRQTDRRRERERERREREREREREKERKKE